MTRHQDPAMIPLTPEWRAKVKQLARTRDPFFEGVQWALDLTDHHQPPETPGATSCPKDTP